MCFAHLGSQPGFWLFWERLVLTRCVLWGGVSVSAVPCRGGICEDVKMLSYRYDTSTLLGGGGGFECWMRWLYRRGKEPGGVWGVWNGEGNGSSDCIDKSDVVCSLSSCVLFFTNRPRDTPCVKEILLLWRSRWFELENAIPIDAERETDSCYIDAAARTVSSGG